MITASFRLRLSEASLAGSVSRSFPDASLRLLAGVRTDETAVELGKVVAEDPAAVSAAIADHPALTAYERLASTEERSLARYETTETELYEFLAGSSLPPEFPIVVENGWAEFDFTGTREKFERVRAGLEAAGRRYELRTIVEARDTADLLTRRQREVLEAAVREGYFEVPRGCTLSELAAELDADTSTVSGVIRRAEGRVLTWFLTGVRDERLRESAASR